MVRMVLFLVAAWGATGMAQSERFWTEEGREKSKKNSFTSKSHPDFTKLAKRAMGAVVAIVTQEQQEFSEDSLESLDSLSEPSLGEPAKGLGSGFFIRSDGYIVTNAHVVEGATSVVISAWVNEHNREYPVRIIGVDQPTDIALLKIDSQEGEKFATLPLGDSDALEVAEWVAAIGSPYGLSRSITVGVVSFKGRSDIAPAGRDGYYDYVQTDASINPGNSGGPLLNIRGEVVGISNAVNAVGQGIGFAVPINMAKQVLPGLLKNGRVARSWLGVAVEDLTPKISREKDISASLSGVFVSAVTAGSPGDRAGILPGDVVLEFNGVKVEDAQKLRWLVSIVGIGKTVPVVLWRNGREIKVLATLVSLPKTESSQLIFQPVSIGLVIRHVDISVARLEGLALPVGALVREVKPGSAADTAGLKKGDVILKVGDFETYAPNLLVGALARLKSGSISRLVIRRKGKTVFLELRKP